MVLQLVPACCTAYHSDVTAQLWLRKNELFIKTTSFESSTVAGILVKDGAE